MSTNTTDTLQINETKVPPPTQSKNHSQFEMALSGPPISIGACCGIGHRLARNLPTIVYAQDRKRPVYAAWPDVPWNELFHDSDMVKAGDRVQEDYPNKIPQDWYPIGKRHRKPKFPSTGTTRDQYGHLISMFELEEMWDVVSTLQQSLSERVLLFMDPRRKQYSSLHLCAHFRIGNNETGDWERKQWRHVTEQEITNQTLNAMKLWVANATRALQPEQVVDVSVFVPSDSESVAPWFEDHVPPGWRIVKAGFEMDKPETGVWFGEHGSKTASVLSQEQKNGAMAEAVADIFGLGECSALWIPNFSSFTLTSIALMKKHQRPVFFRVLNKDAFLEL